MVQFSLLCMKSLSPSLLLVYHHQQRSSNMIDTYVGGTWPKIVSGESSILIGLSVFEVCSCVCLDVPLK